MDSELLAAFVTPVLSSPQTTAVLVHSGGYLLSKGDDGHRFVGHTGVRQGVHVLGVGGNLEYDSNIENGEAYYRVFYRVVTCIL